MKVVEDKIRQLKDLQRLLPDLVEKVVRDAAPQIEDKNIEQLQRGQRSDDSFLPNYSETSVTVYGKPRGPIKLYDQGDFYQGIKVDVHDYKLDIYDTDSKTPKLTEKYDTSAGKVLGLSDESIEELKVDVFLPGLLYEVNRLIS